MIPDNKLVQGHTLTQLQQNYQHACMQVTVLDQASEMYIVRHLRQDIVDLLQAEGCTLSTASHLNLQDVQAEEGLSLKPMAKKVGNHALTVVLFSILSSEPNHFSFLKI